MKTIMLMTMAHVLRAAAASAAGKAAPRGRKRKVIALPVIAADKMRNTVIVLLHPLMRVIAAAHLQAEEDVAAGLAIRKAIHRQRMRGGGTPSMVQADGLAIRMVIHRRRIKDGKILIMVKAGGLEIRRVTRRRRARAGRPVTLKAREDTVAGKVFMKMNAVAPADVTASPDDYAITGKEGIFHLPLLFILFPSFLSNRHPH